jgi:Uma2 family endonuclease
MAVGAFRVERKLFTVEQYEQMVSTGVLGEDERLELIEGDIVDMSPIGSAHLAHVNRLTHLFVQRVGALAQVSVQNPIRLANSEPQPDIALLRPRADYYAQAIPKPADVLLLIEVADSTAAYDRSIKVPLYASGGIPEVWLIDLQERVIEVYRGAAASRYKESHTLVGPDVATILAIPDFNLSVDEIIGG